MTVPSNTYLRYTTVGAREDLSDVIYDISPTDTPIMSSIGKAKATNTLHEWQTDALAAATTNNALIEGDDATAASLSATVRLTNFTQIVGKTVQISGTLEAVDKAGRKSEKAYQLAKASAEIKRDIETILTANQAKTNGTATSAAVSSPPPVSTPAPSSSSSSSSSEFDIDDGDRFGFVYRMLPDLTFSGSDASPTPQVVYTLYPLQKVKT